MIRRLKGLWHLLIAIFSLCYFRFPGRFLTVIGVTGTDGKTTTTTIIYEILKASGIKASMITSVHAVIGGKAYDTGFHVTTPSPFYVQKYLREAVDRGDTHMVLEVTSHGIDQHRVFGIPFAIGVLTNVTPEHLDWHKTMDRYRETKLKLLAWATYAVLNRDEKILYNQAARAILGKKVCTYGIESGDVTPATFHFKTNLLGMFNMYNCLAAISVGKLLEIPESTIRSAIAQFGGISGRMEVVYKGAYTVVVDFAHTPNAIEKALSALRGVTKGKLIHVFGSAGLRDPYKRPLMGQASGKYADVIILTEEDYRTEDIEKIMDEIQEGIPKEKIVHRFPNRQDAVTFALKECKKGDVVVLTGKGHEKSLCRGTKEFPWTDQGAVKEILGKG